METRYAALRIIGTIYKVLGGIAAAITLLLAIGICLSSVLGGAFAGELLRQLDVGDGFGSVFAGALSGIITSLVIIIYGGMTGVTLYAMGEGVYLLLALEANTRAAAEALQSG